jgi:membrane protein YdbS with pleckstrin-like domain
MRNIVGFMSTQANFILKVLILSAGISVLIKYVGPYLAVAATSSNALFALLTPALIVAIALLWRAWKYPHRADTPDSPKTP